MAKVDTQDDPTRCSCCDRWIDGDCDRVVDGDDGRCFCGYGCQQQHAARTDLAGQLASNVTELLRYCHHDVGSNGSNSAALRTAIEILRSRSDGYDGEQLRFIERAIDLLEWSVT